jgi:hypothetical protein
MRRWKLLAALAVVVAAGSVVLWPGPVSVTKENYLRIRQGMSRAELEAILGPPGDYRTGLGEEDWDYGPVGQHRDSQGSTCALPALGGSVSPGWLDIWMSDSERGKDAHWVSDSARIYVIIDGDGFVICSAVYDRRLKQGPLERLRWQARRQWDRLFSGR